MALRLRLRSVVRLRVMVMVSGYDLILQKYSTIPSIVRIPHLYSAFRNSTLYTYPENQTLFADSDLPNSPGVCKKTTGATRGQFRIRVTVGL